MRIMIMMIKYYDDDYNMTIYLELVKKKGAIVWARKAEKVDNHCCLLIVVIMMMIVMMMMMLILMIIIIIIIMM